MSHELLVAAARAVRVHAHAPYSGFAVGAALAAADGRTFTGCNLENASYGLTVCAERNALAAAVAAGARDFTAIAIAAAGGVPPCGACRQVLAELAGSELVILRVDADTGAVAETTLGRLLPDPFVRAPRT
jgi:cytidine deaminase